MHWRWPPALLNWYSQMESTTATTNLSQPGRVGMDLWVLNAYSYKKERIFWNVSQKLMGTLKSNAVTKQLKIFTVYLIKEVKTNDSVTYLHTFEMQERLQCPKSHSASNVLPKSVGFDPEFSNSFTSCWSPVSAKYLDGRQWYPKAKNIYLELSISDHLSHQKGNAETWLAFFSLKQ